MAKTPSSFPPPANRFLAALPLAQRKRLQGQLKPVEFRLRQTVYEPNGPIQHVYFPERGLISVVSIMSDGSAIEVGTIGNEGLTGLPLLFGATTVPYRCFVQIPGHGLRISAEELQAEIEHEPLLRDLLLRYHGAFLVQVMQCVACNGLHTVTQRCCRWLLMCQDSSPSAEVAITHEFLAQMLGVRRASVTEVLQPLQESGLIRHGRGMIVILDRPGLEAASCECYGVIQGEHQRLWGS